MRFSVEVGVEYFSDHHCPSISANRSITSASSALVIDSSALLIVPVNARAAFDYL
jgi:hypothetical protein